MTKNFEVRSENNFNAAAYFRLWSAEEDIRDRYRSDTSICVNDYRGWPWTSYVAMEIRRSTDEKETLGRTSHWDYFNTSYNASFALFATTLIGILCEYRIRRREARAP